jgi:hypothetical protein
MMKKNTRILLLICICVSAHITQAQVRFHIGTTTAYNSTFVLDKGLTDDPRYNAQMTYKWSPVGVAFGADFNRGLGLQLESILSRQGQIYQIIDVAKEKIGERKIDLEYISLPLMLNLLSNNSSRTSFNFMFGPQLSILTQGQEIYQQNKQGRLTLPEGGQVPQGATDNGDGTYTAPASTTVLASKDASTTIRQFKDKDLQLAVGFGLNIDMGKHLYLSTQVRGNYGFTDMRNEDLINSIKANSSNDVLKDLFGRRANLLIGAQLGLHYMFGGNRTTIRSIGSMSN